MFEVIDPVFNVTFFSLITSNTSAVCCKRIETSSKPHVELYNFFLLVSSFVSLSLFFSIIILNSGCVLKLTPTWWAGKANS